MERTGRPFDDFLKSYKEDISDSEREVFNARHAQFTLANELIERRKAAGLTQSALAKVTGIRQPEISRLERGIGNPTMSRLIRIAQALNLRIGFVDNHTRK